MWKYSVWVKHVYLEAVGHSLSEPDVLLLLDVLADVPVLLGNLALSGSHAGLSSLHVAVDLDGVLSAALVRVNPVLAWRRKGTGKVRTSVCYLSSKQILQS